VGQLKYELQYLSSRICKHLRDVFHKKYGGRGFVEVLVGVVGRFYDGHSEGSCKSKYFTKRPHK